MDLTGSIEAIWAIEPAASAIEFEKGWRSWGDIAASTGHLRTLLDEAGVGAGARVGVLLRNHADLVPVLLALFTSDRCLASLNAVSPDNKLAADIVECAAPVLIATAADWERSELRRAAEALGSVVITVSDAGAVVREKGEPARWIKADAPGIAIEMLSSGTTGAAKRIPLPRRNFEKALAGAAAYERGRGSDDALRLRSGVQIVTAPLAHIAGITVAAWIARRGVEAPSEDELRAWLKEHLLPYQVPVALKQVDELPRTPSMKVSQPALRTLFALE